MSASKPPTPRFLNNAQAAAYLNLSPRTLEKQRVIGGGPGSRQFGTGVLDLFDARTLLSQFVRLARGVQRREHHGEWFFFAVFAGAQPADSVGIGIAGAVAVPDEKLLLLVFGRGIGLGAIDMRTPPDHGVVEIDSTAAGNRVIAVFGRRPRLRFGSSATLRSPNASRWVRLSMFYCEGSNASATAAVVDGL